MNNTAVTPVSTQDAILRSKISEILTRLSLVQTQEPTREELPDDIAVVLTHYAASLVVESKSDPEKLAKAIYGALVMIWREGVDFGRFLGPVE